MNQNIESIEVKRFYVQLRIQDIHKLFNKIDLSNLDHTYKDGSKYIDSIAATHNIMDYIEGSTLLKTDRIFNTDYRVFMVDINMAEYFQEYFSDWDQINRYVLDPSRWSYREKFEQYAGEMIDSIPIKDTITSIKHTRPSRTTLEQIDEDFTYILNAVTKKIQGPRRNVLYSNQKVRAYTLLRYWKNRLK